MKKRKVQIKQNQIYVGGSKIPLLSGEVHYWRLNPRYWKTILDEIRQMGLKVISTYIPWDYHEVKRGHFDFTGETDETHNLKGFLELTKREGFWLIIRPGPYIYSEWPNDGIPSYAYKYHRLHPKFLEYAETYLKAVCSIIKPYLASRKSGHIILLQADNEIDPWPDVFGHQYGLVGKPGLFQEFLREKYRNNLHDLNQAWAAEYRDFTEAGPFIACMLKDERGLPLKGDHELRRNLDYFEFKYYYAFLCAKWCVNLYRKLGIDVPIYLNLYPFFYAHDWAKMQSACDLVGIDLYPSNELMEDEHEQRKLIDKVRFLSSLSKVSYIAEFASGVWHARHYESGVLTPNHYRLITLTALLGGAVGWNWYMLVNRDNWYMSPINEWGRRRSELYDVFKGLVRAYQIMKPFQLTKMTDIAVTFNPLQYAARTITADSLILTSLYEADIDYDLFDPKIGPSKRKIVFYSGNQWLSRKAHEHLRSYVESGGILVAFRNYPRKDDYFDPCNVLGFHDPSKILFEFRKRFWISLAKGIKVEVASSVFSFDHVSGKPIRTSFGNYGTHTVGYLKSLGKGKILHLGVEPTKDLLLEILRFFGIPFYSSSPTRDVKTALFNRGKLYYIVAVNNGREDKSVTVSFVIPGKRFKRFRVTNLFDGASDVHTYYGHGTFSAEISRKDGRIFEIKPIS
ncbi:MAG: beta-galactosidase [Candidatus Omnitrophica bacterium]|nr:beta-galactosidase [Candidatus Omnitrophota bacterium]